MPHKNSEDRYAYFRKYKPEYRKTIAGFLVLAYDSMTTRIRRGGPYYGGRSLLQKKEFYKWARSNKEFLRLFKAWKIGGCMRKLSPSVNRINPLVGYEIGNMEWVTFSQNCAMASETRRLNRQRQVYKLMGIKNG